MSPKDKVSQRTLNRALETLGQNHEGIITSLWKGIWERFEIEDYDINLDGSVVVLYGPKSNYGAVGYGRDKNRGKMQVEFMVAQLAELGIPIYIKPCKGNTSDEEQFRDCLPEMAGLISGGGIHSLDGMKERTDVPTEDEGMLSTVVTVALLEAAIVADNGAASEKNIRRIESCGFSYVTRVDINASDIRNITDHCSEFDYMGEGMFCYKHHFRSSRRTTYLFLFRDLLEKGRHNAQRRLERDLEKYDAAKNGKLRGSDYVKVSKVPWVGIDVTLTLQDQLIPLTEADKRRMVRERMGIKCGFFKLESDRELTPREVLLRYRRRAGVEHLISSLKRITGIKPIRVWNPDSVDGSMILALLSEATIAMARCCMDGTEVTVTDEDGIRHIHVRKPSRNPLWLP